MPPWKVRDQCEDVLPRLKPCLLLPWHRDSECQALALPGLFSHSPLCSHPLAPCAPLEGPWLCPGVGRVLQGGSSSRCHSSLPPGANMVTERAPVSWPCHPRVPGLAVPGELGRVPAGATAAPGAVGVVPMGHRGREKGEFSPWTHGHGLGAVNRAASLPRSASVSLSSCLALGMQGPCSPCCPPDTAGRPCPARGSALCFPSRSWAGSCPRGTGGEPGDERL